MSDDPRDPQAGEPLKCSAWDSCAYRIECDRMEDEEMRALGAARELGMGIISSWEAVVRALAEMEKRAARAEADRAALLTAAKESLRWLSKAVADDAFANCVRPSGGKAALELLDAAISKAREG